MLPSNFSKWLSASELEVNWEEVNGGRIPPLVKVETEELFTFLWIKSALVPALTLQDEARPALYCEAPSVKPHLGCTSRGTQISAHLIHSTARAYQHVCFV